MLSLYIDTLDQRAAPNKLYNAMCAQNNGYTDIADMKACYNYLYNMGTVPIDVDANTKTTLCTMGQAQVVGQSSETTSSDG